MPMWRWPGRRRRAPVEGAAVPKEVRAFDNYFTDTKLPIGDVFERTRKLANILKPILGEDDAKVYVEALRYTVLKTRDPEAVSVHPDASTVERPLTPSHILEKYLEKTRTDKRITADRDNRLGAIVGSPNYNDEMGLTLKGQLYVEVITLFFDAALALNKQKRR